MALVKSAFTVSFFISLSRILGFVRDILIARYVGVSVLSDVFFAAFRLPNFFRSIFAEGAFNSSFVPIFIKKMEGENDREPALIFARNIFSLLLYTLLVLIILMEIFMPFVVGVMFPGFKAGTDKFFLLVDLSRITIVYLLFVSLVSLFAGILNSISKFAIAASVHIILNLSLIFVPYLLENVTENMAYALSWAVFIAGILQFCWMLFFIVKAKMFVYPVIPKINPDTKEFFKKLIPGVIGANVMQINLLVDTIIASLMAGAISYIYYADRINQLPLAMIGIAVGIALLPTLSRKIKNNENEEAIKLQNVAVEIGLMLVIPAALALSCLSFEIISTLFERGAFNLESSKMVAKALFLYSLGLPAFVLVKIFEPSFFARGNTKTPMQIAIICLLSNVILNVIFLFLKFGYLGIILSSVISSYLNLTLIITRLIKNGYFYFEKNFLKKLVSILIPSTIMALTLIFLKDYFAYFHSNKKIAELVILITSGMLVYLVISYILGNIDFLLDNLKMKKQNVKTKK